MRRYGLSGGERLKSRKDFEKLYGSGKIIYSDDRKIKAVFLSEEATGSAKVQIAVVVSGRSGKAFWRNRMKRLLRTSYRHNKEILLNHCFIKRLILKIIFSPYHLNERSNGIVKLDDIMPGIKDILFKIERSL